MLTDLQLLALTVTVGVFFIGLIHLANWQAKKEREEEHHDQPR